MLLTLILAVLVSCSGEAEPQPSSAQSDVMVPRPDPTSQSPSGGAGGGAELADLVASGPDQGIESVFGAEFGLSPGGDSPLGPIEVFDEFPATIAAFEDGRLEGNLGCRTFSARVDLVSGIRAIVDLTVQDLPLTPNVPFCESARLRRAEQRYAAALSEVESIESFAKVVGVVRLPLSMSGPGTQLDFEPLAGAALRGRGPGIVLSEALAGVDINEIADGVFDVDRTLTSGSSPEGQARFVDTHATIRLSVGGRIEGDSGCGRYTGRYRPRPPHVTIRRLEVTDKDCDRRNRQASAVIVAGLRNTTCIDLTADGSLVLLGPDTRLEFGLANADARSQFEATYSGQEPQGWLTCTPQPTR